MLVVGKVLIFRFIDLLCRSTRLHTMANANF